MWAFFSALLAGFVYGALLLTPHAQSFLAVIGYTWTTVTSIAVVRLTWQAPLYFIEKGRYGRDARIAVWPPTK